MPCETWREKIIDRIAEELGEEDSISLEQHLADCPGCKAEGERLSTVVRAAIPSVPLTDHEVLEERLVASLLRSSENLDSPSRGSFWNGIDRRFGLRVFLGRPIPSYAALALVLVGTLAGFWFGNRGEPEFQGRRQDGSAIRGERLAWTASPEPRPIGPRSAVTLGGSREGGFSTAPADAFDLAATIYPDTL